MFQYNPPLPGQRASPYERPQQSNNKPGMGGSGGGSGVIPSLVDQGAMRGYGHAAPGSSQPGPPRPVPSTKNNFKLRRSIAPKPPVTILVELLAGKSQATWKFIDNPEDLEYDEAMEEAGQIFTCQVDFGDETYTGSASSKNEAKNVASEQAIKAIVSRKCYERVQNKNNEDPTPWGALASLALHKLYSDWQSQGYVMPADLTNVPGSSGALPGSGNPAPRVPGAPVEQTDKHPVQLLNELNKKAVEYEMTAKVGEGPNAVFVMECKIDDKTFKGQAKNKKDAKRDCALKALEAVHQITYPS